MLLLKPSLRIFATKSSGKQKKLFRFALILSIGFAYVAFQEGAASWILEKGRSLAIRQLKCKRISDMMKDRNFSEEKKQIVRDLLGRYLVSMEDPCLTDYPLFAPDEVAYDSTSSVANMEPTFDISEEEVPVPPEANQFTGEYVIEPPNEVPQPLVEESQTEVLDTFVPEVYNPDDAYIMQDSSDAGTIAYTVAITGCEEFYQDPNTETIPSTGTELYETTAVIKAQVCENTEIANARHLLRKQAVNSMSESERILKGVRKLQDTAAGALDYTMHALVHPMATNCPIEGTTEYYDRTKLLQSQNYRVEILGQPITDIELYETNPYIAENIALDIGIRDSMKLQIFNLVDHPIAVLLGLDTIFQQSMEEELNALLTNPQLKGYYIRSPKDKVSGEAGVDSNFLVVKPSAEEFSKIVNLYINTPYYPVTGWNGEGHNNFEGGMGINGFLSYYFSKHPEEYVELDRCIFANNLDDECLERVPDFSVVKSSKDYKRSCGDPMKCPYDVPSWTEQKKNICHKLHRKFYEYRYKFEEKFYSKQNKQERIGLFKKDVFLGYCRNPGEAGHLALSGNVIEKPEWQAICPPEPCPDGSMMKPDCICTALEDPCDACPSGTYCQTSPTLLCIDCNCGFCDGSSIDCCEFNDANNCRSGPGDQQECIMQNNMFPAFGGSGNVCGGVEISRTAVPNGCGCKPNSHSPCTYNPDWGTKEDKCFVCTAVDLALGVCDTCKECIAGCNNASCMNTAQTADEFMSCLKKVKDSECRANCHFQCMKH